MHTPVRNFVAGLLMAGCLLIAAAAAGLAQDVTFRTYKDVAGFACEFPSDWTFEQARNFDRIFTGPDETARDATIIIQVIEQDKAAEKTAGGQLEALRAQLLRAPDGRILDQGAAPIAAQQAPYLIAAYTALDTAGVKRAFRHIQMVVTTPRAFLLMSYSAPDESFEETLKVFQNCSATLEIEPAAAPAPEAAPPAAQAPDTQGPAVVDPGSEETLVWRHNADRGFWIAVPSIWSMKTDASEPYSVDMQHPDRVEGVIVFVAALDDDTPVKDYADAWEQFVADKIFFMKERLAVPEVGHPGVGLPGTQAILRQYQGEINGATVRSLSAYAVHDRHGFIVVGYHFLGDAKGERRIRAAVESFRLSAP
ncbi:hypothetical protein [Hoeflea sp. BAL378]|uniref:hypothetical protein n=1 Tax=Hoeflea sp. BAL378 TaxID=1547437 RepID=UPI0005541148|nr:hypothetical protein [Hoeflea sp. BAL378]